MNIYQIIQQLTLHSNAPDREVKIYNHVTGRLEPLEAIYLDDERGIIVIQAISSGDSGDFSSESVFLED